jgi:hypothetical protein
VTGQQHSGKIILKEKTKVASAFGTRGRVFKKRGKASSPGAGEGVFPECLGVWHSRKCI